MRKKVFFKSSGFKICGVLDVPKRKKLADFCMVFCHGWTSSSKSKKIVELQKRLSNRGVSSFAIDFFGHGGSQGEIRDITQTIAVNNLTDAITFLRGIGFRRFGVYGSSYGGATAIAYAAHHKSLEFMCLLVPVTKWHHARFLRWQKKMGLSPRSWDDARKYDFFGLARKIKTSTLIVQGTKDKSTPIAGAKKLFEYLAGDKMMVIVAGADHYFENKRHFKSAMDAFENFIAYSLPKN